MINRFRVITYILATTWTFSFDVTAIGQNLSGTITDSSGNHVVGARVTLFNADTSYFLEERTGGVGTYFFTNVPASNYRLGVSHPGKEYQQISLALSSDSVVDVTLLPETQPGQWDIVVQAPEALGGTDLAILRPDGNIFYCHNTKDPFVFNPQTNDTMSVQGDNVIQGCAAPLLLPEGKIIFVGGADVEVYGPGTRKVKTYDYMTDIWQPKPDMIGYRWYPTMTRLTDGKLLVTGGGTQANPARTNTTEIYDPVTGTSQAVDTTAIPQELSPIVMLNDGHVLMTHRPPQLYNPSTQQWNTAADFLQGNRMPNGDHADHELVLLPEGTVVAVGYKSFTAGVPGNFIEKYNPLSNSWRYGTNFEPVRSRAKTVLLPGKNILVLAGQKEDAGNTTPTNPWGYMKIADMYNPYTEQWRRLAPMNYFREYHSLPVLVPDGRVIIVGGEGQPGNEPPFSVIEAYMPPYLYKGVRPQIVNLSKSIYQRGDQIVFDIIRTDSVTSVILMSTPSISHFMNCGNNRYVELPFTKIGNTITATIPIDSLSTLDGYYQLFAMVDEIPSVGKIIKVQSTFSPNTITLTMKRGWNMISVPVVVSDFRRSVLYPQAISNAFAYNGSGYEIVDTLEHRKGYWLKFSSAQEISLSGSPRLSDTVDVIPGWNMIGTLTNPIVASTISQEPNGIVTTRYFGYSGSYFAADTLMPGRAYWVKVNAVGKLILFTGNVAEAE